jgi:hypothetical protein
MTYDPFDPFDQLLTETPAHLLASGGFWVKQQFYEEPPVYQDYFLKFDTQAAADAVLFTEQTNVQNDVVETVKVPRYAAIDVIGTIYKPTGKLLPSESGDAVDEMAPIDGWHVNVRHTEDAPELAAYAVTPTNPVRGWA